MSPDDARMLELLERAVSDVRPRSQRPTDDVLARAARRPWARLSARVRGLLGALVTVGAIGGGAYAFGAASGPDEPAPPPSVTLDAVLPAGWAYDDSGVVVGCGTALTPRTVYRDARIEDVTACEPDEQPQVTGPVLVVGTVAASAREKLAVSGTPTLVNGRAAWALTNGESPVGIAVATLSGDRAAGYLVASPGDPAAPVGPPVDGVDVWPVAEEALALRGQVRASGAAEPALTLPAAVAEIRLTPGISGSGPDAPAYVRSPAGIARVLSALRQPPGTFREGCPQAEAEARSLWLQDAATGRWSRVVVTTADGGCRTAWSELGGREPVGDPVALVRQLDEGEPTPAAPAGAEVAAAHGIEAAVPAGWSVARAPEFDPCTATAPTVVLADRVVPSCAAGHGLRPHQPYLWLSPTALEDGSVLAGDPTPRPGRDGSTVAWSDEDLLAVGSSTVSGRLGVPERGAARFLLVGVTGERAVAAVERLVGLSP
ncbi:hypothetical protein [Motilibacter aurantiacus]|uniref:hypothetical protein n=1 Tax=Motilibacter aurantiacus TaxID=2714955 RepID=UPI00140D5EBC|nr:hypothetical protein [Motilibacter aurantiacus]NHC43765.1 hypothetical protein [Motilibacter aurantiacus]